MKNQIRRIAFTACFALISGIAFAQVPPSDNVPPPPPAGPGQLAPPPMDRIKKGPERGVDLKTVNMLSGKIIAYLTNDRYIYNSFTLQSGAQIVTVRFPEHLGQALMNAAKKGETITVKGFTDPGPDGVSSFQLISAAAGRNQIADTPPVAPVQPITAVAKTYTGNINSLKKDERGMINGIYLNNKVLVDLPPHAALQLQSLLRIRDRIEASGFTDTPPSGAVLAANAPAMIHPQTLTINGQTYLLR